MGHLKFLLNQSYVKHDIGLVFFLLLIFPYTLHSQNQARHKRIRAKGDYTQKATNTIFPTQIGEYPRLEITSFDKSNANLGVSYQKQEGRGTTTLTVYVYPAGPALEYRLRNEFLAILQSIVRANGKDLDISKHYTNYKKENYKLNGYSGYAKDYLLSGSRTMADVYECGEWFFEVRITSNSLDSDQMVGLDKKVLDLFSPINLVKISSLSQQCNISIASRSMRDSLLLYSAVGYALTKAEWVQKNTDSLERSSGFPGLYLDMEIAAFQEIIDSNKGKQKWITSASATTLDYLNQLESLIESGFLKEFIMEKNSMIMIVPDNVTFNFEGYREWKKSHYIGNLNDNYSAIGYTIKGEKNYRPREL